MGLGVPTPNAPCHGSLPERWGGELSVGKRNGCRLLDDTKVVAVARWLDERFRGVQSVEMYGVGRTQDPHRVGIHHADERQRGDYSRTIGLTVNMPEYDHPYGDAEAAVDEGRFERGSAEYERTVRRMKAMWHSRRDFAHEVECCLDDESMKFGVFNGVSDNQRRWFDLEHTRIGYRPPRRRRGLAYAA